MILGEMPISLIILHLIRVVFKKTSVYYTYEISFERSGGVCWREINIKQSQFSCLLPHLGGGGGGVRKQREKSQHQTNKIKSPKQLLSMACFLTSFRDRHELTTLKPRWGKQSYCLNGDLNQLLLESKSSAVTTDHTTEWSILVR